MSTTMENYKRRTARRHKRWIVQPSVKSFIVSSQTDIRIRGMAMSTIYSYVLSTSYGRHRSPDRFLVRELQPDQVTFFLNINRRRNRDEWAML